jgi:hypothetical protein
MPKKHSVELQRLIDQKFRLTDTFEIKKIGSKEFVRVTGKEICEDNEVPLNLSGLVSAIQTLQFCGVTVHRVKQEKGEKS